MGKDSAEAGLASTIAITDHAADAVCGKLMQVRKNAGLSEGLNAASEIDARILLQLTVVRRCAFVEGIKPEVALPETIRHLARRLSVTDRIVVDAELGLGLLQGNGPPGVDLAMHYGAVLSKRRISLARHWRTLHEAFGAQDVPAAPSARAVRGGRYEVPAFEALAKLLTSLSDPYDGAPSAIVIIGDAVIDHILEVEHFPRPGTSMWGEDSGSRPGGKGLNRAVALARLELDARLLAAIGDDGEGREILDYLTREKVDTSLIKVEPSKRTPVTTVVTPADGDYSSIAIKKGRTRLTVSDLDLAPTRHAITGAAAVVLTFEQTDKVIEKVLEIVGVVKGSSPGPGSPWVIVNVSPPRPLTPYMREHLSGIDYLVGSSDDLEMLRPDLPGDTVAEALVNDGVGTVCQIDRSQCIVHRRGLDAIEVDRFGTSVSNVAGAASAFSSALTSKLVKQARPADTGDFDWATAAMATMIQRASGRHPVESVPDGMPFEQSINAMVGRTSTP